MANEQSLKSISKLKRALQTFRIATQDTIPVSLMQAFLLACENEGKGPVELAELGGTTRTTMSRHLLDLSEQLRSGEEGYRLLQRTQDPSNMRAVVYTLTQKGIGLRNSLRDLMED